MAKIILTSSTIPIRQGTCFSLYNYEIRDSTTLALCLAQGYTRFSSCAFKYFNWPTITAKLDLNFKGCDFIDVAMYDSYPVYATLVFDSCQTRGCWMAGTPIKNAVTLIGVNTSTDMQGNPVSWPFTPVQSVWPTTPHGSFTLPMTLPPAVPGYSYTIKWVDDKDNVKSSQDPVSTKVSKKPGCPRCGHDGVFIRMALCCPEHGAFGGI